MFPSPRERDEMQTTSGDNLHSNMNLCFVCSSVSQSPKEWPLSLLCCTIKRGERALQQMGVGMANANFEARGEERKQQGTTINPISQTADMTFCFPTFHPSSSSFWPSESTFHNSTLPLLLLLVHAHTHTSEPPSPSKTGLLPTSNTSRESQPLRPSTAIFFITTAFPASRHSHRQRHGQKRALI